MDCSSKDLNAQHVCWGQRIGSSTFNLCHLKAAVDQL